MKLTILQSDNDLFPRLRPVIAAALSIVLISVFAARSFAVAAEVPGGNPQIQGGNVRIEFDNHLRSRVVACFDKKETVLGPFTASEAVTTAGKLWTGFLLTSQTHEQTKDTFGEGERLTVEGKAGALAKRVSVTVYAEFPAMAFFDVQYTNTGSTPARPSGAGRTTHTPSTLLQTSHVPAFWSYQSGSYEKRPNWVVPLKAGLHQKNFLGMNASDYGGGTPVVDVWRRDVGLAVGHVESRPKLVSLPVSMPDSAHAKRSPLTIGIPETPAKLFTPSAPSIGPPGGLLPRLGRLPSLHDEAGISFSLTAGSRVWRHLVRLGIRTDL